MWRWWRRKDPVRDQRRPPSEPTEDAPREWAETREPPEKTANGDNTPSDSGTLVDIAGLVLAPASLLAGLGIYFGFLHTHAFYRYLNIDASVLSFSTTDYLIRSVNGFLVPMAVLALAALAFGFMHAGLEDLLASKRGEAEWLRHLPRLLAILGVLLVINAVTMLVHGTGVIFSTYLAAPASLCVGVFLTVSGLFLTDAGARVREPHQRRGYRIAAVSGLLLLVGALWGTAQYADSTGQREARVFVRYLDDRPAVVIHSSEPLGIALEEEVVTSEANHASYRYSGARLVLRSQGKYLLLTEGWSPEEGSTILLHDEPGTRLEFTAHQPVD